MDYRRFFAGLIFGTIIVIIALIADVNFYLLLGVGWAGIILAEILNFLDEVHGR